MRLPAVLCLSAAILATPATAALEVFACEPELAALTRELGGELVDVYAATTALQDVHKIQARPSLIARYRQADLVVCTGADLEAGWMPALATKGNNSRVRPGTPGRFEAWRYVTMLEVPEVVDRALGDVHPYGNPHFHTNPENIPSIAQALTARLTYLDPGHAATYAVHFKTFTQRWAVAIERWRKFAAPLRGVAVVSHHRTWVYLYDWLGIVEIATLEPRPGIPPSAAHLEQILSLTARRQPRMVIHSTYESGRAAAWLSDRAGIPVVELPYSVGGAPGADDLFGFYDVLIGRMLAAMPGSPEAGTGVER